MDMLTKASCSGLFNPVTFVVKGDNLFTNMTTEAGLGNVVATFRAFDIEAEEGEKMIVNATDLLEQIGVMSVKSDFTMEKEGGTLNISTDKETVKFHLTSGSTDDMYRESVNFRDDGDTVKFGKTTLDNAFKTKASEFGELSRRKDLADVNYIKLEAEENKITAFVGDYTSQKYNPRKYQLEAQIEDVEGGSTQFSMGIDHISKALGGEISVYFGNGTPVAIYAEEEDYKIVYAFPPMKDR